MWKEVLHGSPTNHGWKRRTKYEHLQRVCANPREIAVEDLNLFNCWFLVLHVIDYSFAFHHHMVGLMSVIIKHS